MLACTEHLRWELQFFVMIHSTFWTEFSFLSCSFIINRWLSFYNCIHSSMETTPTCLHVQNIFDENFNLLIRFTLPFRRSSHFFPIHSSWINDFRFINLAHSSMERTPTCLHVQNIYEENFNFLLWFTPPFKMNSHFFLVHS